MLKGKVLIVLTNHEKLGETGNKTGWYLPEVAHPYEVFTAKGYGVDFVSPKGGNAPMDLGSKELFKEDPVCIKFLKKYPDVNMVTKKPSAVTPSNYCCIFYAGGHGPMFDLPKATEIDALCTKIYEAGGIAAAVCHGTVGLLNVKLSNKDHLIKGKDITGFTNEEEHAVKLMEAMPFALETSLVEKGAKFKGAEAFSNNVVVSDRVVTGQNPASASDTAIKIVDMLETKKK